MYTRFQCHRSRADNAVSMTDTVTQWCYFWVRGGYDSPRYVRTSRTGPTYSATWSSLYVTASYGNIGHKSRVRLQNPGTVFTVTSLLLGPKWQRHHRRWLQQHLLEIRHIWISQKHLSHIVLCSMLVHMVEIFDGGRQRTLNNA